MRGTGQHVCIDLYIILRDWGDKGCQAVRRHAMQEYERGSVLVECDMVFFISTKPYYVFR